MTRRLIGPTFTLGLSLALALPAAAQMREEEAVRLNDFNAALGQGLREALEAGAGDDVREVTEVLRGVALFPEQADLTGDWQCKVMKLGGILPLTIYDAFPCHVDADGSFAKTGGSQRTQGRFDTVDGRLVYLGVGYVEGETPPAYADLSDTTDPAALPQFLPQVAVVEQTGFDTARMLFPFPMVESTFDIIEMTR